MNALPEIPHLEVTGAAQKIVDPDFARITVELKDVSMDASAAKHTVDTQSSVVMDLATQCEVENPDITASQLTIGPEYDWQSGENTYEGTAITREVTVVLRELKFFGQLLQGLADIPVYRLAKIAMDTSQRQEYERQVIAMAVEDAKSTALHIAAGLGLQLKGVHRVSHSNDRQRGVVEYACMDLGGDARFEIGRMQISSQVEVFFRIEETS